MGSTYIKRFSVVYLKFIFNWAACILHGNPTYDPFWSLYLLYSPKATTLLAAITVVWFGLLLKFVSMEMSGFYSFVAGFFFFKLSIMFVRFVHVSVCRDSLYAFTALEYSTVWVLKVKVLVPQLCPTLCNPKDYSRPGSSVYGISQARILEWVAIPFSRGSS